MADHQVYLNNNRTQNSSQLDGAVLKPLDATLESEPHKKVIVIHLLGTHRKYNYRYPESFNKFRDNEDAPNWIKKENMDEYNSYDNAVLYNDYVVSSIIDKLKKQENPTLLVYFSDHGEEVFDTPKSPFSGRNEMKPTPAMYTVPFIVWANSRYREQHQTNKWVDKLERPLTTADFLYTWADMVGLDFVGFDRSRSAISENFVPHPRWIGNPSDQKSLRDFDDFTISQAHENQPPRTVGAQR